MTAVDFDDYFIAFLQKHGNLTPGATHIVRDLCQAVRSNHACLALDGYEPADVSALSATTVAGAADADAPLVLEGNRLYLHRHYQQERSVAEMILARNRPIPCDNKRVVRYLSQHFRKGDKSNRQKLAVFQAVNRQLTIVTGGPGTGKTSAVIRVVELLLQENPDLAIRLAAPTGKAAMRLSDSIRSGTDSEPLLALEVVTLHRLLGMRRGGGSWRHGRDNPVAADAVIVDEASMVDLAMMERLLAALPAHTRLILLGDPHQLPSVDTGNVLYDLCAAEPEYTADFCELAKPVMALEPSPQPSGLANAICKLEKSHRFGDDSAIGRFAADIKAGVAAADGSIQAEGSIQADGSLKVRSISDLTQQNLGDLLEHWQDYLNLLAKPDAPAQELLAAFESNRILCSHRRGFPGVESMNEAIESELARRGLKKPGEMYYPGQPVLITRNDYNLRLFNGDIGVCVTRQGSRLVAFPDFRGEMRHYLPSRLPDHETCFAMTVHKAQGSEFDHVTAIFGDRASENMDELVTRELIYTAVTRARRTVTIYCAGSDWEAAMARSSARASGMADFLAASSPPADDEAGSTS